MNQEKRFLIGEMEGYDKEMGRYYKWFHVAEDELSHRGQIRLMKRYLINC